MTTESGEVHMEIQLWREILSPYEQAVTELVEKFQHLSL